MFDSFLWNLGKLEYQDRQSTFKFNCKTSIAENTSFYYKKYSPRLLDGELSTLSRNPAISITELYLCF